MNTRRAVWVVGLVAVLVAGALNVNAAPRTGGLCERGAVGKAAVHTPSGKSPGLLDLKRSRWDYVAVGGGGAYGFNVLMQLFTYHWRNVRLTAAELTFSFNALESSFDWHLGPTVGFGGHHGPRNMASHWFVLGLWYGQMHPITFFDVPTTYRGVFLMAGYEFRLHFGRKLDWLFGVRLFGVASPLGGNQTGACGCDETGWFCDCEPDPENRIRYPLTFGISVFIGY